MINKILLLIACIVSLTDALTAHDWKKITGAETLSVFLNGRIAGHMITTLGVRGDTVVASSTLETALSAGSGAPIAASISECYKYRCDGTIISASQEMSSPAGKNYWAIDKVNKKWRLKITAGGVENSRDIENVRNNFLNTYQMNSGFIDGTVKAGQIWNDTVIELTSGVDVTVKTTCLEVPDAKNGYVWKLVERNSINNRDESWVVDTTGRIVYKEVFPFVMKPYDVKNKDSTGVNIFEAFMIPASRSAGVDEKIIISGDSSFVPDGSIERFYHHVNNGLEFIGIENGCEDIKKMQVTDSLKPYLQATTTMQIDHPDIRALSDQFKQSGTVCDRINRMCMYVYRSLKKEYTATFSSALETYKAGFGDCGEHAVLLAAILRAASIPSRVVFGVVYMPGLKGYYYHSWVMVWNGSRWIFADPALGVFPANRDRLPLVIDDSGEKMVALARVIGRLKVQYAK